jgi:hypothetical protein
LGLYDESFVAYFEDSDLCYRAWQAGAKVFFVPTARLTHLFSYSYGGKTEEQIARQMARFVSGLQAILSQALLSYGGTLDAVALSLAFFQIVDAGTPETICCRAAFNRLA